MNAELVYCIAKARPASKESYDISTRVEALSGPLRIVDYC